MEEKTIDEITQKRDALCKMITEIYGVKTYTAFGIILLIDRVVTIIKDENTDK